MPSLQKPTMVEALKDQMAEVAKAKKDGGGGGSVKPGFNATNFLRQFRDTESRELKQLSAGQFMGVWEHYDSDGTHQVAKLLRFFSKRKYFSGMGNSFRSSVKRK